MSAFERGLQHVCADIENCMDDRKPLMPFFTNIRDFIVNTLKTQTSMQYFLKEVNTIDSLWEQVSLIPDCDFNVMLKMRLPLAEHYVTKVPDEKRPGFCRLLCNMAEVMSHIERTEQLFIIQKIASENTHFLSRHKLHNYTQTVFQFVIKLTKGKFESMNKKFKLTYERRGSGHTIHATTGKVTLNINFVVPLVFGPESVESEWFALPYPSTVDENDKDYAFLIWNPLNESRLGGIPRLRQTYALIKSLLFKLDLIYFAPMLLTQMFLWLNNYVGDDFWSQELSCVFLDMLDQIQEILSTGRLPYVSPTCSTTNLLRGMSTSELQYNAKMITKTKNQMRRLSNLKKIRVSLLRKFFYMPSYAFRLNVDSKNEFV